MSRIHEALKRAEQERESASPAGTTTVQIPVSPDVLSPAGEGATLEAIPVVTGPNRHESGDQVSLQLLAQQCPQRPWKMDSERLVFCGSHSNNSGSEEFRTLRTRLYQIRQKNTLHTILVSSALPGEGKTVVSANLAQVFVRQHGRRVLLIDADLRRPQMHELLGTTLEPGLTNHLKGEADEYAIIQRGPVENFYFIPGGSLAPNPTELLANGRLKRLLSRLAGAFDWIILDSAPVLPVSDATILADLSDGILLVVHACATPLDMVQKAQHEFRNRPVLGVVLNRSERQSSYGAYYYSDLHHTDRKNGSVIHTAETE
jgi:protein-tyrosine kinase